MENNYAKDYGKCSSCGADKVLNPKTGKTFCKDKCWLKKSDAQPYTPEQGRTEAIKRAQDNKMEGIRIASAGRDAVQITVAQMAQGGAWTDEQIKAKIEEWQKYFYEKIYVDTPFRQ